jgi:hypothetical protein
VFADGAGVMKGMKHQAPSIKSQTNFKFQTSN